MYHDSIHNERLMAVSGTGGCLTWQYPVFALVAQMLQLLKSQHSPSKLGFGLYSFPTSILTFAAIPSPPPTQHQYSWHYLACPTRQILSRHTVVCCAAQEDGACTNGVSILTGTTKSQISCIRSSVTSYPNGTKFAVELASTQGRPNLKFE